jgi:hypothetical protein
MAAKRASCFGRLGYFAVLQKVWCERGDSNPHGFPRQILSLVRLPISPLSHLITKGLQHR